LNGVQLTFFNFSGYLVPGIILLAVLGPVVVVYPELNNAVITGLSQIDFERAGLTGATLVAALFLPLLGFAFLLGVALSDTMSWLMALVAFDRWQARTKQPSDFFNSMITDGRTETVRKRFAAREMIALKATSGWDLYGFAGRARLLSSSGGALIVGAVCYVWASIWAALFLLLVGGYLVFLGRGMYAVYNDQCDVLAFLEETNTQ